MGWRASKMPRIPLLKYSAQWAKEEVEESGGEVVELPAGHAEVWNSEKEAIGFLTRASFEKFKKMKVTKA